MRRGFLGLGAQTPYYPPAGQWAHKTPAEVGMDAAWLDDVAAITS